MLPTANGMASKIALTPIVQDSFAADESPHQPQLCAVLAVEAMYRLCFGGITSFRAEMRSKRVSSSASSEKTDETSDSRTTVSGSLEEKEVMSKGRHAETYPSRCPSRPPRPAAPE